jgi:hypothetical protein
MPTGSASAAPNAKPSPPEAFLPPHYGGTILPEEARAKALATLVLAQRRRGPAVLPTLHALMKPFKGQ